LRIDKGKLVEMVWACAVEAREVYMITIDGTRTTRGRHKGTWIEVVKKSI